MTLLYIALGGAAGALARYGLGGWVQNRIAVAFPWGTLTVNVIGCLLIGLSIPYLEALRVKPDVRMLVAVGVLGAFTTFSAFGYETVALLREGAWPRAVGYVGASVILGIGMVWVGIRLSTILPGGS
ncbi:MAG: fluoride efflux transporter CrcB [Gemmatimonadota bacterium]|nr:fluoride efflux transporter CrcB [Gemmatimonadota bacterium]